MLRMLCVPVRLSIPILCLAMLCGCWSSRELNDIYIVLAMGIDKHDDEYELTAQVADPYQMSMNRVSNRTFTTIFSERGQTLFEALRKMTTSSSRRMYGAHILLVLVDEETAKSGLRKPLDLLLRDSEIRPDYALAVVRKHKARDVLQIFTPTELLPAMDLHKSLNVSEQVWAPTTSVKVLTLMQKLSMDGVEPTLTGLTLVGDALKARSPKNLEYIQPFGKYRYTGIGVFRDDRLIGWLGASDSKAYNYITNNIHSTVAGIKCPRSDGKFAVEVIDSKTSLHPSVVQGRPHMRISLRLETGVAEMACEDIDLHKEEDFLLLQQAARKELEQVVTHGLETVQNKFGTDIFGFGELFHRRYPKLWADWKQDWNAHFKTMTYELDINYKLLKFGKEANPIHKDKKER